MHHFEKKKPSLYWLQRNLSCFVISPKWHILFCKSLSEPFAQNGVRVSGPGSPGKMDSEKLRFFWRRVYTINSLTHFVLSRGQWITIYIILFALQKQMDHNLMCLFRNLLCHYQLYSSVNTRKSCGFVKAKGFIIFLWECMLNDTGNW